MQLSNLKADVFVPDGMTMPDALRRTTHLCVGAHQDDQELMAYHGIVSCFHVPENWFTGVIVTNGGGSARSGPYRDYTDEQMQDVRRIEQRKAATIGEYACQIQLAHPSSHIKDPAQTDIIEDLLQILSVARPQVVYLHNPADKHDTHVASMLRALTALRRLPADQRPAKVLGCEIWRSLDWLPDAEKQVLPVDAHKNIAAALSGIFDSQIMGGKRYDTAIMGRRVANATFFESHATDKNDALAWAMDLTPLIADEGPDATALTLGLIEQLKEDIVRRLAKFS